MLFELLLKIRYAKLPTVIYMGVTIVVSPLIALITDQIAALRVSFPSLFDQFLLLTEFTKYSRLKAYQVSP